jgi:hypothetical protein
MTTDRYPNKQFSSQDIVDLMPAMKVGVLATVNPQGLPHLTLITTLMASSPEKVVWGQFMEGISKEHIKSNPKTVFFIMSLNKEFWRGKANYDHPAKDGKDYEFYNNTPLFRYNSYFGVNTVHYMDLVAHSGKQPLPMNQIVFAAVKTMIGRTLAGKRSNLVVMNPWTQAFFTKLDNLKYLSYIGTDGYPVIIPLIQAQALDAEHLAFSLGAFGDEIAEIPTGADIAVFGMALTMEDVLVRGKFLGVQRLAGLKCGVVKVNWVYNSMPPTPMQIYPEVALSPITEF